MQKLRGKQWTVALVVAQAPELCRLVADTLVNHGITKVYAAMQETELAAPLERWHGQVIPMEINLLTHSDIKTAAKRCHDVNLLFNVAPEVSGMGRGHTGNRIGALGLNLAFIPVIAANGGGLIVNVIPQTSQLRLQLHAISGRGLERRNVHVYHRDLDLQRLFLEASAMLRQVLVSAVVNEAFKNSGQLQAPSEAAVWTQFV